MRAQFSHLERSLTKMVANLAEKPKAILMISGHWEEDTPAIMASPNPPMVYDYTGFPPETALLHKSVEGCSSPFPGRT